jgi:hypothetical protein
MKGSKLSSALLILSVLFATFPAGAWASDGPTVRLVPSATTIEKGRVVNVDVRVEDVSNLYAAEVHLTFSNALLEVLDDDLDQEGIQVLPGSLFPSTRPGYVVRNTADQDSGTVDFAMTLLSPAVPVTGSGTLATIRFSAKVEGLARLQWSETKLSDDTGTAIVHATADSQVQIVPPADGGDGDSKNGVDLIENGGFEETRKWDMPVTPHKADYSTADRHSGSRSVRLGIEPGGQDVYSHSSAYQKIHVPANATRVTLTFWARRFTQETPKAAVDPTVDLYSPAEVIEGTFDWSAQGKGSQYDWQEVLILQGWCYNWLATLMRERSNDGQWTQYTYDLTAFAGQDIVVYFNAINNGWGNRLTWMYVDDVQVMAYYDDIPCAELVRNRGFEWTADWVRANTPRPANYTTDAAHTGNRSMRLGVVPSTWDTYSHSSAYQHVTIPAGASNPTLSFWYKAHSEDTVRSEWKAYDWSGYDPGQVIRGEKTDAKCCGEIDWQEMLLLDADYRLLSGGVVLRQVRNDGVWQQVTYDLSPYKGMTIVLYFNAINDGNGRRTWMYIDDVSVNLCGQQVRFVPASLEATVGQEFTMDLRAESIGDLYGLDTTIRFDPAILEVVDADSGASGVQVSPGDWLPSTTYVVINTADNASGQIRFAATLKNPDPPLNGSGDLVSIRFRAKAAGSTPVWLAALKLVNSDAVVIPATHADGQVTVSGSSEPPSLVGDVNDDGCVDILDLVAVGSQFGSTAPDPAAADINGDGLVDIVDIVLVARDLGLCE